MLAQVKDDLLRESRLELTSATFLCLEPDSKFIAQGKKRSVRLLKVKAREGGEESVDQCNSSRSGPIQCDFRPS